MINFSACISHCLWSCKMISLTYLPVESQCFPKLSRCSPHTITHTIYTVIQTGRKTSRHKRAACILGGQHLPYAAWQPFCHHLGSGEAVFRQGQSILLIEGSAGRGKQTCKGLGQEMMLTNKGHFAYLRAHTGTLSIYKFSKKWLPSSVWALQWKSLSRKLPFCLFNVFILKIFSKFLLWVRAVPGTREATSQ